MFPFQNNVYIIAFFGVIPCKGIPNPRFTAQKLLPTNEKIYSKSVGDGVSTSAKFTQNIIQYCRSDHPVARVQNLRKTSYNTVGAIHESSAYKIYNRHPKMLYGRRTAPPAKSTQNARLKQNKYMLAGACLPGDHRSPLRVHCNLYTKSVGANCVRPCTKSTQNILQP